MQATVCGSIFEVFKKEENLATLHFDVFCVLMLLRLKDTPAMVMQAIINEATFAAFD